jgi:hypothetical protein
MQVCAVTQVRAAMANNGSAAPVPVVSASLLPDFNTLPAPPAAISGDWLLGHMVGFQLVNCTPGVLDVSTYDQHDDKRIFNNQKYRLEPKAAVNCMAAANGEPFDIQYMVNNTPVQRARQSIRIFVIQVPSAAIPRRLFK